MQGRKQGLGYVPDLAWSARANIQELSLTTTSAPASKVAFEGTCFDQGREGACGGAGTAKIVRVAHASLGITLGFADYSPKWFYALARRISTPATSATGPALTDSGINPAALLTVIPKFGAVPIGTDSQCPTPDGRYFDIWGSESSAPANVNNDVQFDAEVTGRQLLDMTAYNIDVSGTADAIAAQVTPVLQTPGLGHAFGIFVDTAFENWNPANGPLDGEANLNDPNGGGHWLHQDEITLAYVAGKRCWGFQNSWSQDNWGLQGRIYVTDTRLVSMTSQAIAVKVNAPPVAWRVAA
jgi:hypothetical protein